MTPHFLKLAKYRLDFYRHCFCSFGISKSCQLFRLFSGPESSKGKPIQIPSHIVGRPFSLRRGTSDIDAFYKIFVWKQYYFPADSLPNPVRTIIDLGSNIGFSIMYFAAKFPEAQIIGVEPDSENIKLLQNNTEGIERVNLIKGGIWSRRCELSIENPDGRPDSYRLYECKPNTLNSISAFGVSDLLEMFNLQRIDLLKVDIEGAEIQLFSAGCDIWLPKVHTLVIELHGKAIRDELLPILRKFFQHHFFQGENDVFIR